MVFDHYVVGAGQYVKPADPRKGAYSRMEAWLWLVANAAYESSEVVNKGRKMMLNPGELMGAYAYLSEQWNWTPETTRYFLKRLELTLMITRWCDKQKEDKKHNQCQVINICNYDRYQITDQRNSQAKKKGNSQADSQANNKPATSEQQESNNEQLTLSSPNGEDAPLDHHTALEAFHLYNQMAERCGLRQCVKLTPDRTKQMLARMRDHGGLDAWKQALANIERSAHLRGNNKDKWQADLDFLIRKARFTKVWEGGWGNGAHGDGMPAEDDREERWTKILADTVSGEAGTNA